MREAAAGHRVGHGDGAGGGSPGRPVLGAVEWFRPGERERVERVLSRLAALGITELRTGVSWADWLTEEGGPWYAWLLPRLREQVRVVLNVAFTPASLGLIGRSSSPPRNSKDFADFIDVLISVHGDRFTHLELWDEPDRMSRWDRTLDPGWGRYCEMVGMAAYWARRCGKRVVLGGTSRPDAAWVAMLGERGILGEVDAVGVHAMPAVHAPTWLGWGRELARIHHAIRASGSRAAVWVTSVSHPTPAAEERRQAEVFLEAADCGAERVYWSTVEDLDPEVPTPEGLHADEREHHLGLCRADGSPKLLCRLLEEGGVERARRVVGMHRSEAGADGNGDLRRWRGQRRRAETRASLITGGAGFIGTNLADRLASIGQRVIVYDSLARPGVERNAAYLLDRHGDLVEVRIEDVSNRRALRSSVRESAEVFHFAAQVAVTTSLQRPDHDHEVNVAGTIGVLEEVRRLGRATPVAYTSTNKVYGDLRDVELRCSGSRYEPVDERLRLYGVGEDRPLEFCSPYGCSKGAADQYVLDYARSYGVPTVVLRMSCIYGPHQCGTEDQGWIAHFLLRAAAGEPVTIYGDGRQVRDALDVSDLVEALLTVRSAAVRLAGRAFNIGGGGSNAVSLLELLAQIRELTGAEVRTETAGWRTGDQRWYVSDTRAFQAATGWTPRVPVREGVRRLYEWLVRRDRGSVLPATAVGAFAE